jgi:DNA-binding MarR family transcriptional regulator
MNMDSSNSRSSAAAKAGVTGATTSLVYRYISSRGNDGMTSRELEALPNLPHHGAVSSALTSLNKRGVLARLRSQRDGYSVYVLSTKVNRRKVHTPANGVNINQADLVLLLTSVKSSLTPEQREVVERVTKRVRIPA